MFATMNSARWFGLVAFWLGCGWLAATAIAADAASLEVGAGKPFGRIEDAVAAAKAGDAVVVYPRADGTPYERVALRVVMPGVCLRGWRGAAGEGARVELRGEGFDYSGAGAVPRAVVQFDGAADGSSIEGFDISGARNASHNGAGVRINGASHVVIRGCAIHGNDMGIMSNGGASTASGADQRIEASLIYSNGTDADPGQNHNLYLGGESVVISGCEVRSSTTGHNVKSRARYTRVEYCYIHDAANRELDLVDSPETEAPGSDAVLLGTIIVKAKDMAGNHEVVHFGRDGKHGHAGTLYVVNCTVVTGYASAVVTLSADGTRAVMANNLFSDAGSRQRHMRLMGMRGIAGTGAWRLEASHDVFDGDFDDAPPGAVRTSRPLRFVAPEAGDCRVVEAPSCVRGTGASLVSLHVPMGNGRDWTGEPFLQYAHPQGTIARADAAAPDIGAQRAAQP
jgi:hypothetical protein